MSRKLRPILEYIVREYVVDEEVRSIDRDSSTMADGDSLEDEKRDAIRRELDKTRSLEDAFCRGLVMSREHAEAGNNELALDDRKEDEDQIADAMIDLLVSFDLATSRTEETAPQRYVYHLSVDWARLRDVAAAAGVDLDDALAEAR